MQVLIIGAGASGLMAAVSAARAGSEVTVLEHMKKPGRKLLLTGNGKCNLSREDPYISAAYGSLEGAPGKEAAAFTEAAFRRFGIRETVSFFEEIGVAVKEQNGLLYPRSGQAQTLLDALLFELERLRVKLKYNTAVRSLRYEEKIGKWQARTDGWVYEADKVILCCGSMAAPQTGSDGSGYELAAMAGHSVSAVYPALTGFLCDEKGLAAAAGARTKAEVSLFIRDKASGDGKLLAKDSGEVQWTEYGLSGIVIFQLSRFAARAYAAGGGAAELYVRADLVPDLSEEMTAASLLRIWEHSEGKMSRKQLLSAFTQSRAAAFLEQRLKEEHPSRLSGEEEAAELARALKQCCMRVRGLRSHEHAQICAGGVKLEEVFPETLESRKAPGLHFAGELLDVDGPCGGYNLQWAWSSGFTAGQAAALSNA